MVLTNIGEIYVCGSDKYGQLAQREKDDEDDDEDFKLKSKDENMFKLINFK